jgi:tight adherence protein B
VRFRRSTTEPPSVDDVATITERLAVLLSAGVSPASCWHHLSVSGENSVLTGAALAARDGESVSSAIAREAALGHAETAGAWRGVACAWYVATECGAPLADSLRDLATSFRSIGEIQRELAVALAGPQATARMVMLLPVVGVLFGMILGFNTLETLFATFPGFGCLVVGTLLMVLGSRWNRRMIHAAEPTDLAPGLAIDLMAIAVTGGGSIDRASEVVENARRRYHISEPDSGLVAGVLDLAQAAGVPAAELLRNEAALQRRKARSDGQRTSAVLAVRLMIPLGLCVLPAFMLLGVAPLVMAVVSSTFSTL